MLLQNSLQKFFANLVCGRCRTCRSAHSRNEHCGLLLDTALKQRRKIFSYINQSKNSDGQCPLRISGYFLTLYLWPFLLTLDIQTDSV